MKKYIVATVLLVVFLAISIPFASSSPDGLETVVSSLEVKPQSIWQGFMSDYSMLGLGNNYLSTLLAGFVGVVFVLLASLALGKAITKRNPPETEKS